MLEQDFSRIVDAYFKVISEAKGIGGSFDDLTVALGKANNDKEDIAALKDQINNSKDPKALEDFDKILKVFDNFKNINKDFDIKNFLDSLSKLADKIKEFEEKHKEAFVSKAQETNPNPEAPKTGDSDNSKKTNNKGKDDKQPQEPNVEVNAEVNKT